MSRIVFVAALMMVMALSAGFYCADISADEMELRTIDGEVTDVDWIGDGLTIQYMVDDINIVYENMSFKNISPKVEIIKGNDKVDLSTIQVGDNVTVKYLQHETSVPEPVNIVIKE